jgi:hypothetical protein
MGFHRSGAKAAERFRVYGFNPAFIIIKVTVIGGLIKGEFQGSRRKAQGSGCRVLEVEGLLDVAC